MADEQPLTLNPQSVDSFVDKLQAWAADLPSDERAVLQTIIDRAGSELGEDQDVEGFAMDGLRLLATVSQLKADTANEPGTLDSWSKGGGWKKVWGQSATRP